MASKFGMLGALGSPENATLDVESFGDAVDVCFISVLVVTLPGSPKSGLIMEDGIVLVVALLVAPNAEN